MFQLDLTYIWCQKPFLFGMRSQQLRSWPSIPWSKCNSTGVIEFGSNSSYQKCWVSKISVLLMCMNCMFTFTLQRTEMVIRREATVRLGWLYVFEGFLIVLPTESFKTIYMASFSENLYSCTKIKIKNKYNEILKKYFNLTILFLLLRNKMSL